MSRYLWDNASQSEIEPGLPALQANTLCKEPFERCCYLLFRTSPCTTTAPPKLRCRKLLIGDRGWVWLGRGYSWSDLLREQGARTSEPRENCITLGSPLCRGLTRATYILCIEHPRQMRLSREPNPGPPALQANTLCKEPLEGLC